MARVGIDIGGTKCAVVLGEPKRGGGGVSILGKRLFPTPPMPGETIDRLCGAIDSLLGEFRIAPEGLAGIGISCGGPLDSARGRILHPPNLPGWDDVPIADLLEARYGIRPRLDNDANACAVAEWKFGAGIGCENMIFLTFGTGLGAGLILGGKLYRGASGMAGEIGHMRLADFGPVGYGKAGSLEGFCSGGGIAQLARQKTLERIQLGEKPALSPTIAKLDSITAKTVHDAANAGDALALEIFTVCGEYLGRGLSVLIDLLNPERIILGGIYCRCEHLLYPAMRSALERESLSISRGACDIMPARLGEAIGDYAALALLSDG